MSGGVDMKHSFKQGQRYIELEIRNLHYLHSLDEQTVSGESGELTFRR